MTTGLKQSFPGCTIPILNILKHTRNGEGKRQKYPDNKFRRRNRNTPEANLYREPEVSFSLISSAICMAAISCGICSGRQNDIQGHGSILEGNWITGIRFFDSMRLGPQYGLPDHLENNKAKINITCLPLCLALSDCFINTRKTKRILGCFPAFLFHRHCNSDIPEPDTLSAKRA
jgi:hypothetical protein